jgi:hypothetical protein
MQRTKISAIGAFVLLCLALTSSLAQTAPATQTGPATLTPQEREFALKQYETTRDNFLQSIAGLSQKQWIFKSAPDRWSVAEVAEHITVAESTIMSLVQKRLMSSPAAPEKREQVKGKDQIILERMPDRSHKAQAPEILRPTGRWATEVDLVKAFNESRSANM